MQGASASAGPSAGGPPTMTKDKPDDNPPAPAATKWWRYPLLRRLIRWSLLAVVLYCVGSAVAKRFSAISWQDIDFSPSQLALAALALVIMSLPGAIILRTLLRAFCQPPPPRALLAANWVAPLGKYVPGKVASVAGLILLLRSRGVSGTVVGSVAVIRQAISVTVALMVAGPLLIWQPVRSQLPLAWLWCGLLVAGGLAVLHPKILGPVTGWMLRRVGRPPLVRVPRLREYAGPMLWSLLAWTLFGVSIWLTARAVGPVPAAQLPVVIGAGALAAVAGFLAVFTPAGLGVREGVLLIVLGQAIGPETAALTAVLSRLVMTLVDVALAGLGALLLRLERN